MKTEGKDDDWAPMTKQDDITGGLHEVLSGMAFAIIALATSMTTVAMVTVRNSIR